MPLKRKIVVRLMWNIGFIAFAIADGIIGVYIWSFLPFLSVLLFIVSLTWIIWGVTEMLDIIFTQGKR